MSKIRPLTRKNLNEAVALANSVFPDEEEEPPSLELPAGLYPENYKDFLAKTKMSDIKYWVALDESGEVVGTIGLYCYEFDKKEACWLGWFCVKPSSRRNGVGAELLSFAIAKAIKRKKAFLRLWTSANLQEAVKLYIRFGFVLTKEEFPKLYYELKL